MNQDYRKALIETANYLIDVRQHLFGNALNVAMNNELNEIDKACLTGNDATIAANVILEGFNYSELTYTNVFCDKEQLITFLEGEPGSISKHVFNEIANELRDLLETLQINLHDLNANKPWVTTTKLSHGLSK